MRIFFTSGRIIDGRGGVSGAAIEVHRHLGPAFLVRIYERVLCHGFGMREITSEGQKEIFGSYKNINIPGQRLDLLIENKLIVEWKAVEEISPIHEAQLLSSFLL